MVTSTINDIRQHSLFRSYFRFLVALLSPVLIYVCVVSSFSNLFDAGIYFFLLQRKWLQNKNDENVVNGSITTPISTQMKIRSRRVASVNARIATLLRKILELQVRYNNVF